ncbi:GerAB/ArcD/ProY family transporter [Brevibacillus borstelensis]|uniref:GerAB/ArcD/ProY family transporter n=1 Tax=Brevibacillus borstelensis TaxID=45462 RepID=UPI0014901E58|nr:endospore germination permease [Brevibacillus borstelensis]MED1873677.1 endospore germination permease [Brevibacillus borstelensis]NOU53220.1 endospore germination permease [Brevibacillus borstelensis]
MRNPTGSIGFLQAVMMIMLSVGITTHVTIIPLLLSKAGRDAWISVLLVAIPFIGWLWLLFLICRRMNRQSLSDWLEATVGHVGSRLLLFPFMLLLYLMAFVNLTDTQTWTTVNYLPNTPEIVTGLVLVLLSVAAAYAGIHSIAIASGLLLPFVVLFGFLVGFGNMPKKDYHLLLPLFQNGMTPVINGMLYAAGGFLEIVLILFLQHHLRTETKFMYLLVLGGIIIILTLSPLTGAIAEFGPAEATRQRYPSYEQWRLLTMGRYIENLEFLSIYQWLSGAFVRLSLCLFLVTELLQISKPKQRLGVLSFLGASMLALMSLPFSDMQFLTFLSRWYFPMSAIIVLVLTMVLAIVALVAGKQQKGRHHES